MKWAGCSKRGLFILVAPRMRISGLLPLRYGGITKSRVDEVIDLVGLTSVAKRRVGKFSLGMGQRLGIAAALAGRPGGRLARRTSERS